MGTVVVVGKKNGKKIFISDGTNKEVYKNTERTKETETRKQNPVYMYLKENKAAVEERIISALSGAPLKISLSLSASADSVNIDFTYAEQEKLYIKYADILKEEEFDADKFILAVTGMVYSACMKQHDLPIFKKKLITKNVKKILVYIAKEVNKEYEGKGIGLSIEGDQLFLTCDKGKREAGKYPDKEWFLPSDYITVDVDGRNVKQTFSGGSLKEAADAALNKFREFYKTKRLCETVASHVIKSIKNKKKQILAMHDSCLDGLTEEDLFKPPTRYRLASNPNRLYMSSSFGSYSTENDWKTIKFEHNPTDYIKEILSDEYQECLKIWREAVEKSGLIMQFVKGVGVMRAGETKLLIKNYRRPVTVKIENKEGIDFKRDVDSIMKEICEKFKINAAEGNERRLKKLKEMSEDKEMHKEEEKKFFYKNKHLFVGEISQMMFLYLDENGGRVPLAEFKKFVKEKCMADDLEDWIMMRLDDGWVVLCDGEYVFLGPNAKYMRKFVYGRLLIDVSTAPKALKDLEEVCKRKRQERDAVGGLDRPSRP